MVLKNKVLMTCPDYGDIKLRFYQLLLLTGRRVSTVDAEDRDQEEEDEEYKDDDDEYLEEVNCCFEGYTENRGDNSKITPISYTLSSYVLIY